MRAPTLLEMKIERLRKAAMGDFMTFIRLFFPILNPGTEFIEEPHHRAFAQHLQAILEGSINTLGVAVCPGSTKTTIFSILFPTYAWLHKPHWRFITTSHSLDNALRINTKRRKVIESDLYQGLFKPTWALTNNTKGLMVNSMEGEFRATAVGAAITGNHATVIIFDDPLTPAQAKTSERTKHVEYWEDTLNSRRVRGQPVRTIGVMQRLFVGDLIGKLEQEGYWDAYLQLPCEYDPLNVFPPTCLGWRDPRTEKGEPLSERMYPISERISLKKRPQVWHSQYQQNPSGGDASLVQEEMFPRYSTLPSMDFMWTAWDLTFGDSPESDEVVGLVFGMSGVEIYIIDMVHGHWHFNQQVGAIVDTAGRYPDATRHYIEKKANGAAAISSIKRNIKGQGVRGVTAWASATKKEIRIASASGYIEAGDVHLPESAPWLGHFIAQVCAYPFTTHDDVIDALSIGLLAMEVKITRKLKHGRGVQQTIGSTKYGGKTGRTISG